MLAYAMNLFDKFNDLQSIDLHPDGEHGKQFDIRGWLEKQGFTFIAGRSTTSYAGEYTREGRSIYVALTPGLGDVVAKRASGTIVAECKGGIINTTHPGQKSRLRRGLCEAVGLLMSRSSTNEKHHAVVPFSPETKHLAEKMRQRCSSAGIEIVLIREDGTTVQ